jgi:hypothetical protein
MPATFGGLLVPPGAAPAVIDEAPPLGAPACDAVAPLLPGPSVPFGADELPEQPQATATETAEIMPPKSLTALATGPP